MSCSVEFRMKKSFKSLGPAKKQIVDLMVSAATDPRGMNCLI